MLQADAGRWLRHCERDSSDAKGAAANVKGDCNMELVALLLTFFMFCCSLLFDLYCWALFFIAVLDEHVWSVVVCCSIVLLVPLARCFWVRVAGFISCIVFEFHVFVSFRSHRGYDILVDLFWLSSVQTVLLFINLWCSPINVRGRLLDNVVWSHGWIASMAVRCSTPGHCL